MKTTSCKMTALAIVCSLGISAIPAQAQDIYDNVQCYEESVFNIDEYVDTAMSNYLFASGLDISMDYTITNAIPVFAEGESTPCSYSIYLITDNEIVGEMNIYTQGDDLSSDFSLTPNISLDLSSDMNIHIIVNDEGKWICSYNEQIPVYENMDIELAPHVSYSNTSITFRELNIDSEYLIEPASTTTGKVSLNVSHVKNEEYETDHYICWAATIAMKVNYLKNKNLSAGDVCDYTRDNLNSTVGEISTVKNAYKHYGISVTAQSSTSKFLTNQKVWDNLNSNNPIDLAICGYENLEGTGEEFYHQVLLTGMSITSTGLSYEFFCPNIAQKKYVYVSGNTDTIMSNKLISFSYLDTWTKGSKGIKYYWRTVYRMYY